MLYYSIRVYVVPIKSLVIVIVFLYDGNKKHFSCQSPTATRAFFTELNQEIVPLAKYVYLGSSLFCCQIIVLDKSLTAQREESKTPNTP